MQGLGDTTAMLKRMRSAGVLNLSPTSTLGSLAETKTFGPNPGALRMFTHTPVGVPKMAPLVVVLHGCTQTADGHAVSGGWIELADRLGFVVLAPEQTAANNPNRCFNWFSPNDIKRGKGEAASIASMVGAAVDAHHLDSQRVFITGLSAGGAMTAVMLATYPDLFAGAAIVAGLPYGLAGNVQEAMSTMRGGGDREGKRLGALVSRATRAPRGPLRLSIWHGEADLMVSPENGRSLARQWAAALELPDEPDRTDQLGERARSSWGGKTPGASVIELNMIHGLGHGTPLATRGKDAVGTVAPFMLEAGVSSTLEIAGLWGLEKTAGYVASTNDRSARNPKARVRTGVKGRRSSARRRPARRPELGEQVIGAIEKHVSPQVQAVIAKALRAAGLMR
jgi:poly(hydroxyalkanoate) depolymerase family esterase